MTASRIIGEVAGIAVSHAEDFIELRIRSILGETFIIDLAVSLDAPMGDEACQLRDLINAARNSEAAEMRARRDAPRVPRREGE